MDISIKLPFEQLLGIIKNLNQKEKQILKKVKFLRNLGKILKKEFK